MEARTNEPQTCYAILHMSNGPGIMDLQDDLRVIVGNTGRFQVSEDIWMERFDRDLGLRIQTACEPPHFNIGNTGYDRHLYAFVKRVTEPEKSKYEGISELAGLIALSRLVHPTSTGDRYCARIFRYGDSNSPIECVRFFGVSADVSLIDARRDWLSAEDGQTLLKLAPWLAKEKKMHERIHRAYWNHESALRSYYLDVKWTLVVSAFEALLNTRNDYVAMQFRERVGQLAKLFNVPLTEAELNAAYSLRSQLVHAQNFLFGLSNVLPEKRACPALRETGTSLEGDAADLSR
jgi:hypothetical protein